MIGFRITSKSQFFDEIVEISEEKMALALNNKKSAYHCYKKAKKEGFRIIYAIKKNNLIYELQNKLKNSFFMNLLFPECVCGFRKRKSYYDFLIPHISSNEPRYYLRLDISDFFGSIDVDDIEESLNYYIDDSISSEEKQLIINNIIGITTIDDKIIQGALTSPILSNLVFRSLDIRIEKYCKMLNITYTRYADDMLFSSDSSYIHNYRFQNMIKTIISEKGFNLNTKKTLKYKNEISLNGYVVGNSIRLSRKKLSQLNNIIYEMGKKQFKGFKSNKEKYTIKNKLAGYRAFLIQSIPYINRNNLVQISKKITKIENLITKYCAD
ncbi:MAG: RNA-directed DNA polymerase [Firmicutes bacterium]|nr:RNA-directed DNA polymerase [Bacillota bacterium]